jgi:2-polyprenyl-6-methoxyphenol hydroxylase-like FAD-dependent oxidoreductase
MRVAIVGGGIGGMTLALSLLDAGIEDVDVFESWREELEEISRAYKRTAGFDPETLNNRPLLSVR